MRLLQYNDGKISLTKFYDRDVPRYAILSHTWGPDTEEVTFRDLVNGTGKDKIGYRKINFCAEQARRDGLEYFWVDTCCIDKSNNTELSRAINSMFRWYQNAERCYVYLSNISVTSSENQSGLAWEPTFREHRWFTRGWTLQELLAPKSVEFFTPDGVRLGDKGSLEQQIHEITRIAVPALRARDFSQFDVEERFKWAETRQTTYEEDWAYCLLGIFGVFMPFIPGEGKAYAIRRLRKEIADSDRAFKRPQEEITKDNACIADLRLTDPRIDKTRIADRKGGLFAGASNWILRHDHFRKWRDTDNARLLWIKGDPGKGKTMLMITIIEELERDQPQQPTTILSYFFCQGTDGDLNNAVAVLRGLIYQLCIHQPWPTSHLRAQYDHAGAKLFQDDNSFYALSKVLESIIQDERLHETYLIVDALDECMAGRDQLLRFIASHVASPRVKWLVSSRNITEIENLLEIDRSDSSEVKLGLEVAQNAKQVALAVDAFIEHKLSDIKVLQADHHTRGRVQDLIREKANGTFLWVALVVQELKSAKRWRMLEGVEKMPATLGAFYDLMMKRARESEPEEWENCQLVLSAVTLAYRPLYLAELAIVSGLPPAIAAHMNDVRDIVALCGSFLTVKESVVYFIHQSVKDYLSDKASRAIFPSGAGQVHHAIFNRSVRALSTGVLHRNMYGLLYEGTTIDNVKVPEPDPLASIRYSCIHWARHFCDVGPGFPAEDLGKIDQFIRRFFLHWLEAVALLRKMSESIASFRQLGAFLKVRNPSFL